jgi:general secretion pathway protein G
MHMNRNMTNTNRGKIMKRTNRSAGFSLIEVLVVVVIIGMLAGAVVLKVGDYMDTAKTNRAKSDIAVIVQAVEAYYLTHSRYPGNDQGLEPLPLKNRNDPWGRPYEYNSPGKDEPFEIISFGADGREGGDGINADITSAQLGDAPKGN